MAKKAAPPALCYLHPTRPARRKCYHCKRPICPECQLRAEGHIFCSQHCVKAERRAALLERLAHWNRRALSGTWFRVALFGSLLLAGVGIIWLSATFDRFAGGAEPAPVLIRKPQDRPPDRENVDWDKPGAILIRSPEAGSVLTANTVTVEGDAPAESMVGLYVNGAKVDVQLSAGGTWRFEKVPLTERQNVLQARYFDTRGYSAFGPAVRVELKASPAPALAAAAAPAAPGPEIPLNGLNFSRAPAGSRRVLLTFDGGSNANSTEAILDTLAREKVRATFFLTGEYMRTYPELTKRMAQEGHVVGNHTFSHPHLTTFSFDGRQSTLSGVTETFLRGQLQRAADLFRLITGKDFMPYWRAPFGEFNGQILRWAGAAGYRHVYWSPRMDTLDWVAAPESPLYRSPREILTRLLNQENRDPAGLDGGVILMHLGTDRRTEDRADAILPELITRLKERGYGFAAVDEVLPAK